MQLIELTKNRLSHEDFDKFKLWINFKSTQGYSALHYASYRGNIEIIKLLIENGADVDVTNLLGINVLHMASQGNEPNSIVYFVEKHKLKLNKKDDSGSTPLHWACYSGSEDVLNFILAYKDNDLNIQDKEGYTPLHLSVLSGIPILNLDRTRLIKKLLYSGANKRKVDNRNRTPLLLAFEKRKHNIIEMLNDKTSCHLSFFDKSFERLDRNNRNVIFFYFLVFTVAFFNFFVILPCKNDY